VRTGVSPIRVANEPAGSDVRSIEELTDPDARNIIGVLFDIDDTVLTHGRLSVQALEALYRLKDAGKLLVGVTGRPLAWGQLLVRQWPVDGMVTENGIVAVAKRGQRITVFDRLSESDRQTRRVVLLSKAQELQVRFPLLHPSDDMPGRRGDYTFDIGEVMTVPPEVVHAAMAYAREQGLRVTRSSIHLHISLDADDKATGVLRFLQAEFGTDPTRARDIYAFIGDSENDAACFAAFRTTVGVANLRGRLSLVPRYVTREPMGLGFAEFATALLRGQ
jgi:hydroxymethylpyrimidine pyrophosphatase-like HAD family hydrolase